MPSLPGRTSPGVLQLGLTRRLSDRSRRHLYSRRRRAFCRTRVAAVAAETEGVAEEAAVWWRSITKFARGLDPEEAMLPRRAGFAPKEILFRASCGPTEHRPRNSWRKRKRRAGLSRGRGRRERAPTSSNTYFPHAHLETHIAIARRAEDGRIHVRSSSQAPLPGQSQTGLRLRHPYSRRRCMFTRERVGGGFGGKRGILTEELCVLAMLKTGRPVKWEFTREEEFIAGVSRHPMKTKIKVGAKKDGTLTAIRTPRGFPPRAPTATTAARPLAASLGQSLPDLPLSKALPGLGYAVYTNIPPSGASRLRDRRKPFSPSNPPGRSPRDFGMDLMGGLQRKKRRRPRRRRTQRLGRAFEMRRWEVTASINAWILSKRRWPADGVSRSRKAMNGSKAKATPSTCTIAFLLRNSAPRPISTCAPTARIILPTASTEIGQQVIITSMRQVAAIHSKMPPPVASISSSRTRTRRLTIRAPFPASARVSPANP